MISLSSPLTRLSSSLISSSSSPQTSAELRDKISTLHNFATVKHVPASLQRKMYAYVGAYWRMTTGLDGAAIMQTLPIRLRGDLVLAIHNNLVQARWSSSPIH